MKVGRVMDKAEPLDLEAGFATTFAKLNAFAAMLGVDDAEGTAQEAIVRTRERHVHHQIEHPLAYARTIILNVARKERRRRRLQDLWQRQTESEFRAIGVAEPSELVERAHAAALVRSYVQRLPQRQREVVVMRYWLDLPEQQIALELGISPGSVKTHAFRALHSLNEIMTEQGHG